MAKKKVGITDWKFILMLLGILLVGLSVFVLNQKVTYQSDAASSAALAARCQFFNYNQCRAQCSQDFPKNTNQKPSETGDGLGDKGDGWKYRGHDNTKGLKICQNSCNAMKRACGRIK